MFSVTDKCLFEKDSQAYKHGFYEIGEARRKKFSVEEYITIEGKRIPVHKVMTYNECWIHKYHSEPIDDITGNNFVAYMKYNCNQYEDSV